MIEALVTTEAILAIASVSISTLAIAGAVTMMVGVRQKRVPRDLTEIVAAAPVHRLSNVLPPQDR